MEPPKPWSGFLKELDEQLQGPIALHCIGGFVVTQHYGIGRETAFQARFRGMSVTKVSCGPPTDSGPSEYPAC